MSNSMKQSFGRRVVPKLEFGNEQLGVIKRKF